jgi:hypothetical protein
MVQDRNQHGSSLLVHGDQPLIGVIMEEEGQEVTVYFVEEEAADSVISSNLTRAALSVIGAWRDLDWDEMEQALDRIRHDSPPTPPIEL